MEDEDQKKSSSVEKTLIHFKMTQRQLCWLNADIVPDKRGFQQAVLPSIQQSSPSCVCWKWGAGIVLSHWKPASPPAAWSDRIPISLSLDSLRQELGTMGRSLGPQRDNDQTTLPRGYGQAPQNLKWSRTPMWEDLPMAPLASVLLDIPPHQLEETSCCLAIFWGL